MNAVSASPTLRSKGGNARLWLPWAALAVIALDAITTQWGAAVGVPEGNGLVLWLRSGLGPIGAEIVFDLVRVAFVLGLTHVWFTAQKRWANPAGIVLAGFVLLAIPVFAGNVRMVLT